MYKRIADTRYIQNILIGTYSILFDIVTELLLLKNCKIFTHLKNNKTS